MPTIVAAHSFRHRTPSVAIPTGGLSLFDGLSATLPTFGSATGPHSDDELIVAISAGTAIFATLQMSDTSAADLVASLYFKIGALPGATQVLFRFTANAGNPCEVSVDSGGVLSAKIGAGTLQTGRTISAGTYYRLDCLWKMGLAGGRTFDWQTAVGDGAATTHTQAVGPAEAASTGRWIMVGNSSAVAHPQINVASPCASQTAGDYPLGAHKCLGYVPDSDGTHSVGTATFRKSTANGGTNVNITNGTTDANTCLDEWPTIADGNGSDDWVEKSAGTATTDYVEIAFTDPDVNEGAPWAVQTVIAIRGATATAHNHHLTLVENTTAHGTLIWNATSGVAAVGYSWKLYAAKPTTGAWTRQALADTKMRLSSSDINPVPRFKSLLIEAVYPVSADATVTGVVADATGAEPAPAITADGTVTGVVADATGVESPPTVSTATDQTVTGVVADATGDEPDPTITADGTVTGVVADATGDGNDLPMSAEVVGAPATAAGSVPPATVTTGTNQTVTGVPADATGDEPDPTVQADQIITGVVADATGDQPDPTVGTGAEVTGVVADATGTEPAPTVTADSAVTGVVADGTGDEPNPAVTADGAVTGVVADATGDEPDPTVAAGSNVTGIVADATGDQPAPTVTADAAVTGVVADGTGDEPAPVPSASINVAATPADATGDALPGAVRQPPEITLPTSAGIYDPGSTSSDLAEYTSTMAVQDATTGAPLNELAENTALIG